MSNRIPSLALAGALATGTVGAAAIEVGCVNPPLRGMAENGHYEYRRNGDTIIPLATDADRVVDQFAHLVPGATCEVIGARVKEVLEPTGAKATNMQKFPCGGVSSRLVFQDGSRVLFDLVRMECLEPRSTPTMTQGGNGSCVLNVSTLPSNNSNARFFHQVYPGKFDSNQPLQDMGIQ